MKGRSGIVIFCATLALILLSLLLSKKPWLTVFGPEKEPTSSSRTRSGSPLLRQSSPSVEIVVEEGVGPPETLIDITGRVIDDSGTPVPDAQVELQSALASPPGQWEGEGIPSPEKISSSTDDEGEFVITMDPASLSRRILVIQREGYTRARIRNLPSPHGGECPLGDIVLSQGARISGQVLLPDRTPAQQVHVYTAKPGPLGGIELIRQNPKLRATCAMELTDSEGKFTLHGVPAGKAILVADSPDHPLSSIGNLLLLTGNHLRDLTVELRAPVTLRGKVQDPWGKGISDAHVMAIPSDEEIFSGAGISLLQRVDFSTHWERGRAITREDGTFEINALESGPYDLAATAANYSPTSTRQIHVDQGPTALTLRPNSRIILTVRDRETNLPVKAFSVRIEKSQDASNTSSLVQKTPTKAIRTEDGTHILSDLDPDLYRLTIKSKDYAQRTFTGLRVDSDPRGIEVAAFLDSGTTLRATLVTPDGNPVAAAQATLYLAPRNPESLDVFSVTGDVGDALQSLFTSIGTESSGEDGGILFPHLAAGIYRLRAHAPRLSDAIRVPITIREGGEVDLGRITLFAGGNLIGSVHSGDGGTEPRAKVTLRRADGFARTVTTDGSGIYRLLHVQAGTYYVQLESGGLTVIERAPKNPDGSPSPFDLPGHRVEIQEGETVRVDLQRPRFGRVRGRVETLDGTPVPELKVSLYRLRGVVIPRTQSLPTESGEFEFKDLLPDLYQLAILANNSRHIIQKKVLLKEGETAEVPIQLPQGAISGSVRSQTGDPLQGASIRVSLQEPRLTGSESAGRHAQRAMNLSALGPFAGLIRSDQEGHYRADYLTDGAYQVEVKKEGFATQARYVTIENGLVFADLDFVLEKGGGLEGKVLRYESQSGIPYVQITLTRQGGSAPSRQFLSNEQGRFMIHGLAPGHYRVTAEKNDFLFPGTTVQIFSDTISEAILDGSEAN